MVDYNTKIYTKQGGDERIYQSGASVDYETGAIIKLAGTDIRDKLENVLASNDVTVYDDGGAIDISGIALITGGTGIADLTLAAPEAGVRCEIRIDSLSSGSVVVTTGTGVTFDGTNNTATFDAADEALVLAYSSATQWQIVENVGSVALSDV